MENDHNFSSEFHVREDGRLRTSSELLQSTDQGEFWAVRSFHYDNQGRLDFLDYDYELDEVKSRRNFVYASDGSLLRMDFDNERDGSIDATEVYLYDSEGLLKQTDSDQDADGQVDSTETMLYDLRGNLLKADLDRSDTAGAGGPDGTTNRRRQYAYDAACNPVEERWDDTPDGEDDSIKEFFYECWQ